MKRVSKRKGINVNRIAFNATFEWHACAFQLSTVKHSPVFFSGWFALCF